MKMQHDMKEILGEDFFNEEKKCGFIITKKMKLMMAMEIDLYLVFAEICNKYHLRHFLFYGSLLGAIRHNGFIPWDDDMDVAMPREDFNIFMEVASKELSDPYSLQNPYTYPNCFYTIPTLRNSMGTFTAKIFKDLDINKGIPLDIFPLDSCNPDTYDEDKETIKKYIMQCSTYMKKGIKSLTNKQLEDQKKYKTDDPLKSWETVHQLATNKKYLGSDYYSIMVVTHDNLIFPKKLFNNIIMHKFETIEVPIPEGYDELLKILYGDYLTLPPMEKRGIINKELIIDPSTPYLNYDFSK